MDTRRAELMRDLDNYLSVRLKGKDNDDGYYSFKKSQKVEVVEQAEPIVEEPELENEYGSNGPGIFKSLWQRFTGANDMEESAAQEAPAQVETAPAAPAQSSQAEADFKDLAKLSLEILRRLPSKELQSFKKTDEFSQFKELLRKNKVIK